MNVRHPLTVLLVLMAASALGLTSAPSSPRPGDDTDQPARIPVRAAALTWTQNTYYVGTWDNAVTEAAAHVEGGFDDWRLPTVAEIQAALQDGSFGQIDPNVNYWYHWTSKKSGTWAYAARVVSDANGDVIASQSGQVDKILKRSSVHAKFVRP